MKLIDILRHCDFCGLYAIVYDIEDDEIPMWEGNTSSMPYWVADMYLIEDGDDELLENEAISYRISLGEKYNDKPGLVISVKYKEKMKEKSFN